MLDLFAGSGALGLEALSRGAATATFVELNPASLEALRANIEALGVGRAGDGAPGRRAPVRRRARIRAPSTSPSPTRPTRTDAADRLVALFRRHPFARILSVEHPAGRRVEGDETRRYGDTAVTFCRAP